MHTSANFYQEIAGYARGVRLSDLQVAAALAEMSSWRDAYPETQPWIQRYKNVASAATNFRCDSHRGHIFI